MQLCLYLAPEAPAILWVTKKGPLFFAKSDFKFRYGQWHRTEPTG